MSFSFSKLGKGGDAGSYYEKEMAKAQEREAVSGRGEASPAAGAGDALADLQAAALAVSAEGRDQLATAALARPAARVARGLAASAQDGYYVSSKESPGQWWTPASSIVRDGSNVDGATFRSLLAGYDPETGEALCQRPGAEHRAGYDMTLSAPKSVSVLWMSAGEQLRHQIEEAQSAAVKAAYDLMHDHGLFVVRLGAGGAQREAAADVMVARFRHHTSRKGDPQLHDHGVIINIGRASDGKTRTLDTTDLLQWQGAIAASYRVKLAERLEALGFRMVKDGRNAEVAGISETLRTQFSKRRSDIEEAAREHNFSTAEDRARAGRLATSTRDAKDGDLTPELLEERWTAELEASGYSHDDVVRMAREAARAADQGPVERLQLVRQALAEATQTHSVIEERHVWRLVLEHSQGQLGLDEIGPLIAAAEGEGVLVKIGQAEGRPVYSTPAVIRLERQMLLDARADRRAMPFDPDALDQAIADLPLSAEQEAMIRHLVAGPAVAVGEGSAGSGKSRSSEVFVRAAEASGMSVKGFAPSWKAAGVLKRDSRLEDVAALQGYLNQLDRGTETLTSRECLIVDEAGMVSMNDMARLLRHAREAGARVILLGDRRQLEAIGAGAPLTAIAQEIGAYRLKTIRRQADDLAPDGSVAVSREWMRRASEQFADGRGDQALVSYDAMGSMRWSDDRDQAIDDLVADWTADALARPDGTRAVITPRNADVRDLNERLRSAYRAAGGLTGEDLTISAVDRSDIVRSLPLAIGDRIAFGERVEAFGIDTSDIATVRELRSLGRTDAEMVLAMDKDEAGKTRVVRLSALVGWRAPGDTDRRPKLQHAYAGTLTLNQGQTVDRAFIANLSGLDRRAQYVAMTRHRQAVSQYVDTERVTDILLERAERGDSAPTLEDAKAYVGAEALRQTTKTNVADFVQDRAAWLETGEIAWAGQQEMPRAGQAPADPDALLRTRMEIRSVARAMGTVPRAPAPAPALRRQLAEQLDAIAGELREDIPEPAIDAGAVQPEPARQQPTEQEDRPLVKSARPGTFRKSPGREPQPGRKLGLEPAPGRDQAPGPADRLRTLSSIPLDDDQRRASLLLPNSPRLHLGQRAADAPDGLRRPDDDPVTEAARLEQLLDDAYQRQRAADQRGDWTASGALAYGEIPLLARQLQAIDPAAVARAEAKHQAVQLAAEALSPPDAATADPPAPAHPPGPASDEAARDQVRAAVAGGTAVAGDIAEYLRAVARDPDRLRRSYHLRQLQTALGTGINRDAATYDQRRRPYADSMDVAIRNEQEASQRLDQALARSSAVPDHDRRQIDGMPIAEIDAYRSLDPAALVTRLRGFPFTAERATAKATAAEIPGVALEFKRHQAAARTARHDLTAFEQSHQEAAKRAVWLAAVSRETNAGPLGLEATIADLAEEIERRVALEEVLAAGVPDAYKAQLVDRILSIEADRAQGQGPDRGR